MMNKEEQVAHLSEEVGSVATRHPSRRHPGPAETRHPPSFRRKPEST